jgi:hypothetical protein
MAGERALPGLGLKAFWTLGSNGWKPDLDQDLLTLSVAVQGKSLAFIASLPGSPVNGDIYIMTAGANINQVAIRDNGAWVYLVPFAGWTFWSVADAKHYRWDGTAWAVSSAPADTDALTEGAANLYFTAARVRASIGVIRVVSATTDTPVIGDASGYLQCTNAAATTITVPPNASVAFPIGTSIAFEQGDTGIVTVAPGAGVTLNSRGGVFSTAGRYAVGQIKKTGTNTWTVFGDLA